MVEFRGPMIWQFYLFTSQGYLCIRISYLVPLIQNNIVKSLCKKAFLVLTQSRIGRHQHTILATDFLYQLLLQQKIDNPLNESLQSQNEHMYCKNVVVKKDI